MVNPKFICCPKHQEQVILSPALGPRGKGLPPEAGGTVCITDDKQVMLMWNQKQYVKTIPLDPKSNVATMQTVPGYFSSQTKITEIETSMVCHNVILANEI